MKSSKLFALIGLLSATGAGSATAAVVSQVYSPFGRYDDMLYAASLGPIPVFVRGNPFAGDSGNQGVIVALQRHTRLSNLKYVAAASPDSPGYHVVLAFGGFVPGVNYCAGRADFPLASSAASGTQVAAIYCLGRQLRSQALVSGEPSRAPSDANFDSMMAALATEW